MISFILSIFFSAILVLRVLWSGATYPESNYAVLLGLSLILLAAIFSTLRKRVTVWRFRLPDIFILAFFLAVLIYYLSSSRPWIAGDFLVPMAACACAYFLAAHFSLGRSDRAVIGIGLLSGVLLVSLYGIYQYGWGLKETQTLAGGALETMDRNLPLASRILSRAVFSAFVYPNALAGYLAVIIPFACLIYLLGGSEKIEFASGSYFCSLFIGLFACCIFSNFSSKWYIPVTLAAMCGVPLLGIFISRRVNGDGLLNLFCFPLVLLPLLTLFHTSSEAAWFSLLAGICVAWLYMRRRYVTLAVFIFILAAGAFVLWRFGLIPAGFRESLGARRDYWRVAWSVWRKYPLFGLGLSSFPSIYAQFRLPSSEEGRMVHSIYLTLASETGLVGLGIFCAMALSIVRALWSGGLEGEPYTRCALVSWCAFLILGVFDSTLSVPETTLILWALTGLAVSRATFVSRPILCNRAVRIIVVMLIPAAIVLWIMPHTKAAWYRADAIRAEPAGRAGAAVEAVEKALEIEPRNPYCWDMYAGMLDRAGKPEAALEAYQKAVCYGEGIPAFHFHLATCYRRLSENGTKKDMADAAIKELERANQYNPNDVDYRMLLGYWYELKGDRNVALPEFRRAFSLIQAALEKPRRIRRHSPAEYGKLEKLVSERIAGLEK